MASAPDLSAIDEDDESASPREQDDISWEGQGSRLNVVVSSVSRGSTQGDLGRQSYSFAFKRGTSVF